MEAQALVSVIIPVYNVEAYLRECVESVINQTYKNLEIILIDDGSTDSSGEICDKYAEKDSRISVVHQENGGLSVARNTGLINANGDYIYFLDSDDYIAPNTLEVLVSIAEKDNSDIVFFDAVSFTDTDDFSVNQNYIRKNRYKTDIGYIIFSALHKSKEYHSAVYLMLLKKSFIDSNKICFIPSILHEDMVFTYQVLCLAAIVSQCNSALYYRRYRKNSIMTSSKTKNHFFSCIAVCKHNTKFTFDTFKKDIVPESYSYLSRCAFNVFNVYGMLCKADRKSCRKELKEFKQYVIDNDAYGNSALKMRCYGKVFWFVYKVFEKSVGRLMKGNK